MLRHSFALPFEIDDHRCVNSLQQQGTVTILEQVRIQHVGIPGSPIVLAHITKLAGNFGAILDST